MPLTVPTRANRYDLVLTATGITGEVFNRAAAGSTAAPAAGDMRAALVGLRMGEVVTNIYAHVTVAGSGVTLAKMGIWNTSGTLLASTATVHTQFTSGTGFKGGALSSAYTVPADGGYYLGAVWVGGTVATLLRGNAGTANLVGASVPVAVTNTGQTDIGNLTLTVSAAATWFGWN